MRYPPPNGEHLQAPPSQYRVIGVDVDDASGTYVIGDFASMDAAHEVANSRAGVGSPVYIYDDRGEMLVRLGSWH